MRLVKQRIGPPPQKEYTPITECDICGETKGRLLIHDRFVCGVGPYVDATKYLPPPPTTSCEKCHLNGKFQAVLNEYDRIHAHLMKAFK